MQYLWSVCLWITAFLKKYLSLFSPVDRKAMDLYTFGFRNRCVDMYCALFIKLKPSKFGFYLKAPHRLVVNGLFPLDEVLVLKM